MKKLLLCLVIVGIILVLHLLTGCDYRKMTPAEIAVREQTERRSNYEYCISNLKSHIEVIEWSGHSYVVYHNENRVSHGYYVNVVSMTHNPDCNCMKKSKNN